jgi:hypothetical protein
MGRSKYAQLSLYARFGYADVFCLLQKLEQWDLCSVNVAWEHLSCCLDIPHRNKQAW